MCTFSLLDFGALDVSLECCFDDVTDVVVFFATGFTEYLFINMINFKIMLSRVDVDFYSLE